LCECVVGIEVVPVGAVGGGWHAVAGRFAHRSRPPLEEPLDEPLTPLLDELVTPLLEELVTPLDELVEKPELLPLLPPDPLPASLLAATEPPHPDTSAETLRANDTARSERTARRLELMVMSIPHGAGERSAPPKHRSPPGQSQRNLCARRLSPLARFLLLTYT